MSKQGLKINSAIRAEHVRLIDENNTQAGVIERYMAISKARDVGLDLVEVDPNSDPPVCRIMDYGKWLYQQKRKVRESHKKTALHSNTLKEIRLRPETDKHDIEIKVNHAREFIAKGHKVQFTLQFKGRQVLHQEKGDEIFNLIVETLEPVSKIDSRGRLFNRRMILVISPKA